VTSPSDRSMALGSTHSLVKMSTRNIPEGKGGRCVRLTTSPPSRSEGHEIWEPKLPGTLWATPDLLQDCLTFTIQLRIPRNLKGLNTLYCQPLVQNFTEISQTVWTLQLAIKLLRDSHSQRSNVLAELFDVVNLNLSFITHLIAIF
jgi:hypothetical protein